MSTSQPARSHLAKMALSAAILSAAIAPVLAQLAPSIQPRPPVRSLPAPPASAPAPDPGNTGKPDDPAAPLSRDPGDLMSSNTSVYVDDSFASVDKLRKAIDFARKDQAQLAINQFQDIVSNYGQKLVLLNDNSYVSITDYVRERLLQMPAVKNGMYDQLFGSDARRDIDAAVENRDVATLIRMSDRYFPSTAALKGLDQAAQWYFERGEFSAAAQTWRKLLNHPLVGGHLPEFIFRAAVAQHLAQNDAAAATLRDRLQRDFADATGTVAGKQVTLLAKLDELLGQPAWVKVDIGGVGGAGGDEWPAFGGGPSHSLLLNTHATIGAKLWSLPLTDNPASSTASLSDLQARQQAELQLRLQLQQGQLVRFGGSVASSIGFNASLSSHPVLSNGTLFIHLGNQIVAVSANAGTRLWGYPSLAASDQAAAAQIYRSSGMRLSAHDSVAVYGDQVFAVMGTGPGSGSGTVMLNGRIYASDGSPLTPTRLVCLSRDDGRELWSYEAAKIPLDKPGALTFIGSPLVTRQGIFLMARKSGDQSFTQQYLVRLDRESGEPTWKCYICSTSNYNSSAAQANVPVPTLVDDVLYISTGQGADCAVDANVGRILWLRVTGTKDVLNNARPVPSWQYNPPVIVGDKMVSADSTQNLRIYDRWTGRLLKTVSTNDLNGIEKVTGAHTIDVLAGAVGSKIIFSVKNVSYCYDIEELLKDSKDKPTSEWYSAVVGAGAATGRPFLSSTGYYVPFANKLVCIDLKTGLAEQWDWPPNEKGEPGKPGNLLVTSEQVVVVNDLEVAGYSKWETARDNRLARIKTSPRDPAAYLDLSEVSFRTDHQDLAQENMKKAVDLANSGAVSPGQSTADILGRLYLTNLAFAQQMLGKNAADQRAQSRFYFEQCRASARTPEQQAEWRLRLADLSLMQDKPEEAVTLFSEILTDPALRVAGFRELDGGGIQSAGSTAEKRTKDAIAKSGQTVYQRFEDQAAALTQRATAAKDTSALQQVVDGYPNSNASLAAATTLAALYQDSQDWENARRVLWWLEPRVQSDAQAKAIANLVTVSLGLKKYPSASAWASRGLRQYKDFSWTQAGGGAGKKITFADLKSQIASVGGTDIDGRLPTLLAANNSAAKLELDPNPLEKKFVNEPSQLLVPVETTAALRQPNLLFLRSGDRLRIYDTAKAAGAADLAANIQLPHDAPAVLVGATKDFAVLMQADAAIILDLKTKTPVILQLKPVSGAPAPNPVPVNGPVTRVINLNGGQVTVINGQLVLNGPNGNGILGAADAITLVDSNTGQVIIPNAGGNDPDSARRAAFAVLGNAARFSTARILNGNLVLLAGNQIQAFTIETGKPAWGGGTASLPPGAATALVGNEDMVVVQVDAATGRTSTFCAFDAETGKALKQVKLDNEHAIWRALGDDGTLFAVTDRKVIAYDMVSQRTGLLWERNDIGARFAGAAALTLDGLVVVSDTNDALCLALESGENRWLAPLKLNLTSTSTMSSPLRSAVQGDFVVFQASDGSAAFFSMPITAAGKGQVAWYTTTLNDVPPRQSLQFGDNYFVEFFMGSTRSGGPRSVLFTVYERKGGILRVRQPLGTLADSPMIRSWQLLDHGIAFEVGPTNPAAPPGTIYFWRTTAPKQTPLQNP